MFGLYPKQQAEKFKWFIPRIGIGFYKKIKYYIHSSKKDILKNDAI
jgi:hypothetical protein